LTKFRSRITNWSQFKTAQCVHCYVMLYTVSH